MKCPHCGKTIPSKVNGRAHDFNTGNVVERLPLIDGQAFELRESLFAELALIYPAVDVPQTLREMRGWLIGNPDRRKTRRGVLRFVTRWLQGEQEKYGGQA